MQSPKTNSKLQPTKPRTHFDVSTWDTPEIERLAHWRRGGVPGRQGRPYSPQGRLLTTEFSNRRDRGERQVDGTFAQNHRPGSVIIGQRARRESAETTLRMIEDGVKLAGCTTTARRRADWAKRDWDRGRSLDRNRGGRQMEPRGAPTLANQLSLP